MLEFFDVKKNLNIRSFYLSSSFVEEYENKQPTWGFNGMGYFVYKRTYARPLSNGQTEEWYQTVKRVVEGVYNVQKIHCKRFGLPWNDRKAQSSAQEMFRRMWDFKFLPPGRGLWAMGTDIMYDKGSAALNNCGFVSTKDIAVDFAAPFCFLMDMSMLGVGVGGDCKGAGTITIREPDVDPGTIHRISDSREGVMDLGKKFKEQLRKEKEKALNANKIKGKYKIQIWFRSDRSLSKPIAFSLSAWQSGMRLHGGGDEMMFICQRHKEARNLMPQELKFRAEEHKAKPTVSPFFSLAVLGSIALLIIIDLGSNGVYFAYRSAHPSSLWYHFTSTCAALSAGSLKNTESPTCSWS